MRKLVEEGKIILKVPYVIKEINGDKVFSGVDLLHFETKEIETIECDESIFFLA